MRISGFSSLPFITHVLEADLKIVALVVAVFLYAFFGMPTPDAVSWVEIAVGGLIVCVIGVAGFRHVLGCLHGSVRWFVLGQVFLLYGVCAGLIGGLLSGSALGAVLRDLIPFGFMFLPLFFIRLYEREVFGRVLTCLFIVLGCVFSVRTGAFLLGYDFYFGYAALSYLANSPAVLFAALFLCGLGLQRLAREVSACSLVIAVVCLTACFIVLIPVVMTAQRASMLAVVVYTVLIFGFMVLRAPRRMMVVGSVVAAIAFVFFDAVISSVLGDAVARIEEKSALVGDNKRIEDVIAVWDTISVHPLSLLFGNGWGASFTSPAVMDVEVYFTHSLLSSMLLKIGVVGLLLCAGYIGALFFALLRMVKAEPVMVLAIVAPLLIDVFLYAAFKSLDFGLLLAMIPVVVLAKGAAEELHLRAPYCMKKA
jgi:hypothetical protein